MTTLAKKITASTPKKTPCQQLINDILQLTQFSPYQLAKYLHLNASELAIIHQGKIKNPRPRIFNRLLHFYCSLIVFPTKTPAHSSTPSSDETEDIDPVTKSFPYQQVA
jgi:hypothetical protein